MYHIKLCKTNYYNKRRWD